MTQHELPPSAQLKIDLMFHGIRYTDALGKAAEDAFPNFYPYRFQPNESDPTGKGFAPIPYLLRTGDGTTVRIKGDGTSRWSVSGSRADGYYVGPDGKPPLPVSFEPRPDWMRRQSQDGTALAKVGVSLHSDMAVVNIAPGCEYFLADKKDGASMRCTFCTYGAPDARIKDLGQDMSRVSLPEATYLRMQEALGAAIAESDIRHIYLVGGSMTDWRREGERFIEVARRVQEVVQHRIPVSCGSGALPEESLQQLHRERLVDNICFNLEVYSQPLFEKICPGKNRFVGYERWIASLQTAVGLWGRERVYTAMVAGIELEPEHAMSWQAAADLALEGADFLCARGIIPIYSLYWPLGGRERRTYLSDLRAYFKRLNLGYRAIRERHGLRIWDGFMCHKCAYMQLECDIDRALAARGAGA